jgi:hypothetical protein
VPKIYQPKKYYRIVNWIHIMLSWVVLVLCLKWHICAFEQNMFDEKHYFAETGLTIICSIRDQYIIHTQF